MHFFYRCFLLMVDNQQFVFLLNFCLSAPFDNFVPLSRGDILLRAISFCDGTASFLYFPDQSGHTVPLD